MQPIDLSQVQDDIDEDDIEQAGMDSKSLSALEHDMDFVHLEEEMNEEQIMKDIGDQGDSSLI